MVRLGQAERVVDRLAELAEQVEIPIASIMADHARTAVDQDAIGLLIAAERFGGHGLCLHAAEAAAAAFNRLRETKSGGALDAARLFTALLDCCDGPRTPALAVSRPTLSQRERQIAWLAAAGVTMQGHRRRAVPVGPDDRQPPAPGLRQAGRDRSQPTRRRSAIHRRRTLMSSTARSWLRRVG